MATASTPSGTDTSATLKAYEDKINAQIRDAKAKVEQLEAKAATQRTQAESKAIDQLKTTRQNLEQKVRDLKTTQGANLERAHGDISAEVAKLHTSIDKLTAEFNASMKK
jgi:iron-sulfur cluster repair protein YtfE (RIC family)